MYFIFNISDYMNCSCLLLDRFCLKLYWFLLKLDFKCEGIYGKNYVGTYSKMYQRLRILQIFLN